MTRILNIWSAVLLGAALITIIIQQASLVQLRKVAAKDHIKVQSDSVKIEGLKYLVLTHGEGIDIDLEQDFLLSDSNNRYIKLKDVVAGKKKYIYHIDETNCPYCVEKYLPFLKRLSAKLGKGNVIILGSYQTPKYLFMNLQKYQANGIPIYNLAPAYLQHEKITSLNVPYIFAIDSSLNVSHTFIPEKGMPELSELYNKMTSFN